MIIGNNYGELDTETGERKGFNPETGTCENHDWINNGEGGSAYRQCSYCGEREPLVE